MATSLGSRCRLLLHDAAGDDVDSVLDRVSMSDFDDVFGGRIADIDEAS